MCSIGKLVITLCLRMFLTEYIDGFSGIDLV